MRLAPAPPQYAVDDQNAMRREIEAAANMAFSAGSDVHLARGERLFLTFENAITAHAGGTKAAAYVLTKTINHVSVCATAGDSLLLPPAKAGRFLTISHKGANAAQVFGQGTDTINDVATATGVSQAKDTLILYHCPVDGKWYRS